jgi:DNA mismatch repair protein MutL
MSDIIKLLPENIANQIAAGEVVQRPASVVKELLENAVDAGATKVSLILKDAGRQLVQVIDNGKGMSETDARLCFDRHATSKIKSAEDLFNIQTYGFRGEALASIASVAQVELKSKQPQDELGTLVRIEASEIVAHERIATTDGTSIAVKNLFYNIPARRNFLKSNSVEMRHVMDEFMRVALAYPEVALSLHHNDLELYNLSSENLTKRIVNVLGNSYREKLLVCKEETDWLKIHGYIGTPESARKTRGDQFFFVNNRFIKSNYLHHAIAQAFDELIPSDSFPFYVINFEIDPSKIDVNVHPTKTEIKFEDEKTIYAILKASVGRALGVSNMVPSLDFDFNINVSEFTGVNHGGGHSSKESSNTFNKAWVNNQSFPSTGARWDEWMDGLDQSAVAAQSELFDSITIPSAINNKSTDNHTLSKDLIDANTISTTFQLHLKYIVTQIKSGVLLVDQNAAHERVLFEKFQKQLDRKMGFSQQFLFPQSIELSPLDFALVLEMEEELKRVGFVISVFSNNTIVINGLPADIVEGGEKELLEGLIEQFRNNQQIYKIDRQENIARSLAKKAAIKQGVKMQVQEMNGLIDQLFACKTPNYSPDGRPVLVLMDMNRIDQLFQ